MPHTKTLLAIFIAGCLQAGMASAAVEPERLRDCVLPPIPAVGVATCNRLLASGELSDAQTITVTISGAFARLATDNYDRAPAEMDKLVARFPESGLAHGARAYLLALLERWPEAVASARRAIHLDDSVPHPYMAFGELYEYRGDSARAIVNFEKAAFLGPDVPLAQASYCWALATANRELDKALAACNRAIALMRQPVFLDSRGLVHFRKGNYRAAIADYDEALALDEQADSLHVRGLAKLALGQRAGGQADLEAAARLDPDVGAMFAEWGVGPVAGAR